MKSFGAIQRMQILLLATGSTVLLLGCELSSKVGDIQVEDPLPTSTLVPSGSAGFSGDTQVKGVNLFSQFMGVMNSKCVACHSNMIDYTDEQAWIRSGWVVAGYPESSKVFLQLKGNGIAGSPASMPKNASIESADVEKVRAFIKAVTDNSGAGGSGQSMAGSPRLGDRFYVAAVLNDIFGSAASTITLPNILKHPGAFGGPCDVYETVYLVVNNQQSHTNAEIEGTQCYESNILDTQVPVIGVTNAAREGWVIRACEAIVANATLVQNANIRIHGTSPVAAPTAATVLKAYQLFYPGRAMPPGLSESLLAVAAVGTTTAEKWNYVLLTLCMSPGWQIP